MNFFTSGAAFWASGILEVYGEERLVEKTLVDGVDQRRDNVVDSESSEAETEDTIVERADERIIDISGLSEHCFRNHKLVSSLVSQSDGVLSEESRNISVTLLNSPWLTNRDIGGGLRAVEQPIGTVGVFECIAAD